MGKYVIIPCEKFHPVTHRGFVIKPITILEKIPDGCDDAINNLVDFGKALMESGGYVDYLRIFIEEPVYGNEEYTPNEIYLRENGSWGEGSFYTIYVLHNGWNEKDLEDLIFNYLDLVTFTNVSVEISSTEKLLNDVSDVTLNDISEVCRRIRRERSSRTQQRPVKLKYKINIFDLKNKVVYKIL